MRANYTWGLLIQKLNITIFRASCQLHMCNFSICTFSSPLYASIWLKFWQSWVAWLLCLCPTFPLIRLGHKGSTSTIITIGSTRCVPQTGWSRKLAFLREYSVGELKMFLHSLHCEPPEVIHTVIFTVGSTGCVPRTGWSRKLAFLREYSVGEQKMIFTYSNIHPQMFYIPRLCSQFGHVH